MNYINNNPDIIDMDSHEIYITWEGGYPFGHGRRGAEIQLSKEMELELMATKIERQNNALKNFVASHADSRKIDCFGVEVTEVVLCECFLCKAAGATP